MIDLEPEFKNELYSALREDETNLKAWFLEKATGYVEDKKQPSLFASQATNLQSKDGFDSPHSKMRGDPSL